MTPVSTALLTASVSILLIATSAAGFGAALYGNLRYDKRLVLDDLLSGAVLGLANVFAKPLRARWPVFPGYFFDRQSGTWWLRKPILGGRFQFKAGYRSYSTPRGIVGVPCLSITRP